MNCKPRTILPKLKTLDPKLQEMRYLSIYRQGYVEAPFGANMVAPFVPLVANLIAVTPSLTNQWTGGRGKSEKRMRPTDRVRAGTEP
jgi:hypothetical protein